MRASGAINGAGRGLNISQSSTRGVIDWNSFSIGAGRHVSINNGSGATLNRVTGQEMSYQRHAERDRQRVSDQSAGCAGGPSGVMTTGGRFVASTLDADNNTFMQGGSLTLSGTAMAL